jgi:uncharacterized membrane protein YsdA (DUF1294 family)
MSRIYVWSAALGLGFTAILFLIFNIQTTWWWYWNWLFAASVAAFILYGIDKTQSKRNGRRIPNAIHHMMALIGGYPGAFLGRIIFHHKSNIRSNPLYFVVLILSLILSVAYIYWHYFGGR